MRSKVRIHIGVVLGLSVTGIILFHGVLETDFWSPEDLHSLSNAVENQLRGEMPLIFMPTLSGGYPVNPIFALEFRLFELNPRPYLIVNLMVHILNSYLAFLLVNSLLHDRRNSFIAAMLFVLTVGSYGKNLMFASGVSSLVYATICLVATLLHVYNEKRASGRFWTPYALAFHVMFVASLFMRGGSVSILAAILFYNFFFKSERGRPTIHTNSLLAMALLIGSAVLREAGFATNDTSVSVSTGAFLKNLPGYLILMVFPLQQSELLEDAPLLVQWLYAAAPFLRVLVGLSILSFSMFGFVFGNRAIRFYIAWMYVMIAPFAFLRYPEDWLNLRFLYLVSLGFCVVLTTGTMYAYRLLHHRRIRRYLAFTGIALYSALTIFLVFQLDRKNDSLAQRPATKATLAELRQKL